jgi:hypothetical protein
MGSSVSCSDPNMCRDWSLVRTILQNCLVLSFIAREVWVVEAHCCSTSYCWCRGIHWSRTLATWISCIAGNRGRPHIGWSDRSCYCCNNLLLIHQEDESGPSLAKYYLSARGQGLLKQNLQGHKYKKKKKKPRTFTFLVTNALRDYTRMISKYFTVAISTRD